MMERPGPELWPCDLHRLIHLHSQLDIRTQAWRHLDPGECSPNSTNSTDNGEIVSSKVQSSKEDTASMGCSKKGGWPSPPLCM